ncbi:MAG: DUF4874 domain-containing protein [Saprospiraceae bacterium]
MRTLKTTHLLVKVSLLLILVVCQTALLGQTVSYDPTNALISNPERGLHKYSITAPEYATTPGFNNLPVATLTEWRTDTDRVTIVFRYFLLDAFLDSDINSVFLDNIQTDFDNVRAAGLKVIVRFSYSNAQGSEPQQPEKAQILSHITQLAPILSANKDVIFSYQAGFLGTWGEWYYTNSSEFGTEDNITPTQWANRKELIDAMLAATPLEIPIQVRYVGIKLFLYGGQLISEFTAYKNTANSRIGFYNDAFLNDYGDQGTYFVDSQCQNPFFTNDYYMLSNESKYLPLTGETNGLNACSGGNRTKPSNALFEMSQTHWTALNRDYHPDFWEQFIGTNFYDDIVNKLGYRFVLISSTVTAHNTNFDLSLTLINEGFARPFRQREVYLVLENTATNEIIAAPINTDWRTWTSYIPITQNFDLGISGTFQLYLWIPDSDPNLAINLLIAFNVQILTPGIPARIYNKLLQTVSLETVNTAELSSRRQFTIFPNPSSEFIQVRWGEAEKETIQIHDVYGHLLREVVLSDNEKIQVSDLPSGQYLIRLKSGGAPIHQFFKQ